ncbi:hypothetical protein AB5I41_02045 [Sphingomonas sp. MMS24-JH45]
MPANLHTQALDGVIEVDAAVAKDMARRAAREEGMLRRHLVRRDARRDPAEAARPPRRRACPRLQLRHGRAFTCRCRTSCRRADLTSPSRPLAAVLIGIAAAAIALPAWVVATAPAVAPTRIFPEVKRPQRVVAPDEVPEVEPLHAGPRSGGRARL